MLIHCLLYKSLSPVNFDNSLNESDGWQKREREREGLWLSRGGRDFSKEQEWKWNPHSQFTCLPGFWKIVPEKGSSFLSR
jgi:hypothetical protein